MGVLWAKLKETILAVVPITLVVLVLHFSMVSLEKEELFRFLIGAVWIIVGLSIFLLGADIAIAPVGNALGSALARRKSLVLIIGAGLVLGFFINIAEPDLLVLAQQIQWATGGILGVAEILIVVSIGIGLMVALGLTRIVFQVPVSRLLWILYGIIGLLAFFSPRDFLGIAFDAGGATTGSMTVPFIFALGMGVSMVRGGSRGEIDSFGLVGVASAGPMIAVLGMALLKNIHHLEASGEVALDKLDGLWAPFMATLPEMAVEVAMAISPLIILTLIAQKTLMHLPRRATRRVILGFIYTYIGFVCFLTGVGAGFMDAGKSLGALLAQATLWQVLPIAAILGLVVILAEPSVHVLMTQIEDITGGAIKKGPAVAVLALGVSLAICLSVLRIFVPGLELWHLLLLNYGLALFLTLFTPPLFVGIAFDSGGVASGPMTATFILAFMQGLASQRAGISLLDAFGTIAMVALTPLLALQIFGIIYHKMELKRRGEELG